MTPCERQTCCVPRPTGIDAPPQLAGLPRESRGYPVPAEAPWVPSGPRLADIDPHRTAALGFSRACAVCGFTLPAGRPVWRTLSQRDAAYARGYNRELDVDPGMAGHLSCMIYSAFACPYWASPAGRLRKDSKVQPGAPRGTRPAIRGFSDIWILLSEDLSRPILGGPESGATNALFGYVKLVEDLPFKDPSDLRARYDAALAEDLERLDLSSDRSFWTDAPADLARLQAVLEEGVRALETTRPVREVSYNGDDRAAFELPLQ